MQNRTRLYIEEFTIISVFNPFHFYVLLVCNGNILVTYKIDKITIVTGINSGLLNITITPYMRLLSFF
jgi:hypothetical protein